MSYKIKNEGKSKCPNNIYMHIKQGMFWKIVMMHIFHQVLSINIHLIHDESYCYRGSFLLP